MDDDQRVALRARGQQFIARFIGVAEGSRDLVEALGQVLAPDARVHLQNGEIVTPETSARHIAAAGMVFPDLEVEFGETLFPDERVFARVRMTSTSSGRTPFIDKGGAFDVGGAFLARITPDGTVGELWSYLNPGFGFSFPPRGLPLTAPPRDEANESCARNLYEAWVRSAEAGEDFVSSVGRSLAPGGVVHLGNGDVTGSDGLDEIFARIGSGLHDLAIEIEDVMFDGAFVIAPFRMSGIHSGSIGMLAATGRRLPSTGALLARANTFGQAAEVWMYAAPAYAVTFPPGRA